MDTQTVQRFEPPYAVPPGETLEETLAALEMSQAELARRTGLTPKTINHIIKGNAPITPETALALEKVTGVRARLWNNLEVNYQEALSRRSEREALADEIELLSILPVKELAKRGAISASNDKADLVAQLLTFFGVADRASWEAVWLKPAAAFKQSEKLRAEPGAVAAWLRLGDLEAMRIDCEVFSQDRLRESLHEIRGMTRTEVDDYAPRLVELCATSGVALVFVPEIPGARAWGATRWASPAKAVIQLSLRYRWEDHFWFSFFHEVGHVLLHGKKQVFVDSDGGDLELEGEANRFAARVLIPRQYEPELMGLRTLVEIQEFAERIDLHPGIVVGRLQREKVIDWKVGNGLRRKLQFVERAEEG